MSILGKVLELGVCGKKEESKRLMGEEMQKLAMELSKIASRYPKADLPLVIATLQAVAVWLENIVGPKGRELAESLIAGTQVIGMEVDAGELKKQMEVEEE